MTDVWTKIRTAVEEDWKRITGQQSFSFEQPLSKDHPLRRLDHYIHEGEKKIKRMGELIRRHEQLLEAVKTEREEAEQMLAKRQRQRAVADEANEKGLVMYADREIEVYTGRIDQLLYREVEMNKELEDLTRQEETMKHKLKDMKLKRMEAAGDAHIREAKRFEPSPLQTAEGRESRKGPEEQEALFDEKIRKLEEERSSTEANS
ncbi:hypothetical protein [Salisediminibacterium beveridgei]|nr:hypothetical protein [Salisediminibacterium beveridgei]